MAISGGGGEKLASLFVEFKAKGAEGLDELFRKTHTQLKAVTEAVNQSGTALGKLADKHQLIAQAQDTLSRKAAWATITAQQKQNFDSLVKIAEQDLKITKAQDELGRKSAWVTLAAQQGQSTAALVKNAQETLRLTKAQEEFVKRVNWAQLVAEQGRFGAALAVTAQKMEILGRTGRNLMLGGLGVILGTGATAGNVAIDTFTGSLRLLSGEIGMAFIPLITAMSAKIQGLAEWFKNLSVGTKQTIANFVTWAALTGGIIYGVYRIVTAVQALTSAINAMSLATKAAVFGLVGIAAVAIGALTFGLAGLVKSKTREQLAEAFGHETEEEKKSWIRGMAPFMTRPKKDLRAALASRRGNTGSFMGLEDAWRKMMEDAQKGELDKKQIELQQRANDIAEQSNSFLGDIQRAVQGLVPLNR